MNDRRLIFCRTPLQAVVIRAVQEVYPARDTVIYQPTSASPKHRAYFDDIAADEKLFIDWIDDRPSHFIKELRSLAAIPRRIRRSKFDEYLVSSYDSLVFALLAARRPNARMRTFDDGVMSLLPSELQVRMEQEPRLHRRIKALAGARNTPQLLAAVDRHHTIYDPADVVFDRRKTVPVPLPFRPAAGAAQRPLTVMLGTPIAFFEGVTTPEMLAQYEAARGAVGCDIFIPHPAEKVPAYVADHVPDAATLRADIELRIAEDVIGQLYARGHRISVYGIASSALVNVRSFAETRNIIIPGVNEIDREVFERLGVASIPVHELIG